jgi:hypothetical protein
MNTTPSDDNAVSTQKRGKQRTVKPLSERFWSKVAMGSDDECWNWQAAVAKVGYGAIGLGRKHEGIAFSHRVAWTLTYGPIPDGLYVLHRCDNRRCCNPAHLFLGTHADNMQDAKQKGRLVFQAQPERMVRGERHPRATLNDAIVRKIRELRAAGLTHAEIATRTGATKANVFYVASGRSWNHVT